MKLTLGQLQKQNKIPFKVSVEITPDEEITIINTHLTAKAVDACFEYMTGNGADEDTIMKNMTKALAIGLDIEESKTLVGSVKGSMYKITEFISEYDLDENVKNNLIIETAKAMLIAYVEDLAEGGEESPIE